MSIRQIRVKQFKALSDPGPIELRPLTLLVGPNSSGKSSVIQALLMMKQTAESTDVEIPLVTEAPGAHAHMGHYRDFVHGHRLSSQIELEIVFEGRMRGRVLRGSPQSPTSETCRLGARFSYRAQRRQRIVPTESWIEIPENKTGIRDCRLFPTPSVASRTRTTASTFRPYPQSPSRVYISYASSPGTYSAYLNH